MKLIRAQSRGRGFSLVEVLLAIFILGIGMIMVACIFPVGADWTRQNAEESVSGLIARNAVGVIQTKYTLADFSGVTTSTVQGLPAFPTKVPVSERAYHLGAVSPWPAANPQGCSYYWTALIRRTPSSGTGGALDATSPNYNQFDLYILVFRKGSAEQVFAAPGATTEVPLTRGGGETYVPMLVTSSQPNVDVQVGWQGIGLNSGTSYRQILTSAGGVTQRPAIITNPSVENVIFAPPATSTTVSPLVYIYQTTVTF